MNDDATSAPQGQANSSNDAPNLFQRAATVFEAIRQAPTAERERLLENLCNGDAALSVEVRSLLAFHDRPSETLDTAILRTGIGAVIGRYRVTDVLGEGGMGTVYLAVQEEPVRREVALKVIKLGMDTRQVVRRFEAERQAIAQMEHPNVARVLDAGSTSDGRPYFVMELVRGLPITQFCDARHLPLRARLRLFLDVCAAVQHAHQKGVIHRDLKPSNILVTDLDGRPVAKVIDFGIAKALSRPNTDRTFTTTVGHAIGTPDYMSPEQAGGSDVDVRSDVYALGVILYELLVGITPLRARLRTGSRDGTVPPLDELRRRVRDDDPLRPLSALATVDRVTVARERLTDERTLVRMVRGDLEAIALKALALKPSRRYATIAALAEDLDRHLRDEPVAARVPSAAYYLAKFARRHTVSLVASVLVAAAIIVGLVLALLGFETARQERDLAVKAQRQATLLANEVRDELFQRDIDRGRQRVLEGNLNEGRDLLWTALLSRPDSEQARWALREMMWNRGPFVGFWIPEGVRSIAALLDGDGDHPYRAIVGVESGTPCLVDASDGSVTPFQGPNLDARDVAVSPNGRWLACGDTEGTVTLWDIRTLRFERMRFAVARGRTIVRFLDDERLLCVGGDGMLRLIERDGEALPTLLFDGGAAATHLAVGPTGSIAVGYSDGRVVLVEPLVHGPASGSPSVVLPQARLVAQFQRGIIGLDFDPTGALLGVASAARDYAVYDCRTWQSILNGRIFPGTIQDLRFSRDGATLILPGWWDTIEVDVVSGLTRSLAPLLGTRVDQSRDGRALMFSGHSRSLAFILMTGTQGASEIITPPEDLIPQGFNLVGGGYVATSSRRVAAVELDGSVRWSVPCAATPRNLTVSPDGAWVAVVLTDGTLRVFSAADGSEQTSATNAWVGESGTIRFDPRSERLAFVTRSLGVRLLSLIDETNCVAFPAGNSEILSLEFDPEGERLFLSLRRGDAIVITLANEERTVYEGVRAAFTADWSADGLSVAMGLWSGDILVWEPRTDQQQIARGHSAFPSRIMAHPTDPDLYLTCSDDGTVRIWDRRMKQDLAALTPYGPRTAIRHVEWTRDGTGFYVVGPDAAIRMYSITAADRSIEANRGGEMARLATPVEP